MGIVVSYDVSDDNPEMKEQMEQRGYRDSWVEGPQAKRVTVNLPNSTLWHKDKKVEQGLQDMKASAAAAGVELLRAVAVPDSPSMAIPGDSDR